MRVRRVIGNTLAAVTVVSACTGPNPEAGPSQRSDSLAAQVARLGGLTFHRQLIGTDEDYAVDCRNGHGVGIFNRLIAGSEARHPDAIGQDSIVTIGLVKSLVLNRKSSAYVPKDRDTYLTGVSIMRVNDTQYAFVTSAAPNQLYGFTSGSNENPTVIVNGPTKRQDTRFEIYDLKGPKPSENGVAIGLACRSLWSSLPPTSPSISPAHVSQV